MLYDRKAKGSENLFKDPKKDDNLPPGTGDRLRGRPGDVTGSRSFDRGGARPYEEPEDEAEEMPPVRPPASRPGAARPGARPGVRQASATGSMRAQPEKSKGKGFGFFGAKGAKPAEDKAESPKVPVQERFKNWLAERRKLHVVQPEKIEIGRRIMALGIDFCAAFLLSMALMMLPLVNRFLDQNMMMLALVCVRDYFYAGHGLGKNIMGLRVVDIFNGQAPTLKAAIMRNLVYIGPLFFLMALQRILGILPLPGLNVIIGQLGQLLATLYVLVILPLECYRSWQRDDSMRLGDEIAGTCIVESETDFSEFLPKK